MKLKIMLMSVVLTLASSGMASNVKWGLNVGQAFTGSLATGTMYLVWDNSANGLSFSGDINNQTSFSIASITDSTQGTGTIDSGYYYNATGQTITPTTLGSSGNGNRSFYLVAISSDGLTLAYSSLKNINISSSALSATGNWNTSDFTVVSAVPEPTALALLAFGAAAVGLRRKFRK